MEALDPTDIRLLDALQKDAQLTTQELGGKLGLSASQTGRRRQRLDAAGYIRHYMAQLQPAKLGLDVQAFIQVQMSSHNADHATAFQRYVLGLPEITAAFTLTGEADYLLRVYCAELSDLHRLVQDVLLPHPAVARVQSQIVMDQLKADAPLPI